MTSAIRIAMLLLTIVMTQAIPLTVTAQTAAGSSEASISDVKGPMQQTASDILDLSGKGWNDPHDIELVSGTFNEWTNAVIAKERAKIESFHDEGFRAGLGDKLLTKAQHVQLELTVGNAEMRLLKITAARRVGDVLLVWSKHFIRVTSLPEIPSLGLLGDWGDEKAAKKGFVQDEFSVWRFEGARIKCLAFAASRRSNR
jgi:hypothetical protein